MNGHSMNDTLSHGNGMFYANCRDKREKEKNKKCR